MTQVSATSVRNVLAGHQLTLQRSLSGYPSDTCGAAACRTG